MNNIVADKIANLRKRSIEINLELQHLEATERKRQRCINDVEEAICLLKTEFMGLRQMLEHFPDLRQKREFWEALVNAKDDIRLFDDFDSIVEKYAGPLLEDRDLVMKLCAYNVEIYRRLSFDSSPLIEDEDVVKVTLAANPATIQYIPFSVQVMYPALMASAIRRLPLSNDHAIRDRFMQFVCPSLWSNREVALAWGAAGGHYLVGKFPEAFNDDEDLLAAFLQNNCSSELDPSWRLRAYKPFMLHAVKADPAYLAMVSPLLSRDWDLLLAAMTDPRICFVRNAEPTGGLGPNHANAFAFWVDAANTVRDKLRSHDVFVKLILGGIKSPSTAGGTTPLSLLNRGTDTSLAFTKPIAEYLGVPMGEELRMLREARKNLALMGIHWESAC